MDLNSSLVISFICTSHFLFIRVVFLNTATIINTDSNNQLGKM